MFDLKSKHIVVETTTLCNANCVVCPRDKYRGILGTMDFRLFKKIVDDASQYDVERFDCCGFGEPFLDRNLFKNLAYVREKMPNAKTYISSTCFMMDKSKYEDVLRYVDTLKISFFGASKKTYESVHRGSLVYEKSLENIRGLLKARGEKKGPRIIGLLVLTEENKDDAEEWIKFWEPKLDEVMVWKPHNWANLKNYRKIDKDHMESCKRPLNGPPFIHVDGKVSVCCWDINSELVIGDMKTQTLEEVYNSSAFRRIKKAHESNDFKGLHCEECEQTNSDKSVLVYSNNKDVRLGRMTSGTKLKGSGDRKHDGET